MAAGKRFIDFHLFCTSTCGVAALVPDLGHRKVNLAATTGSESQCFAVACVKRKDAKMLAWGGKTRAVALKNATTNVHSTTTVQPPQDINEAATSPQRSSIERAARKVPMVQERRSE
ncbi:hypothetical protein ACH5RR_008623 [Cinchona calisaya]|uniref:Uncharacterized protein n=1 Tax=Cinchona calisaya TaxID=153742 RepID=A0ABD3AEE2_9GENT